MKSYRAFADENYDYYELTQSLGFNNSGYGIKDYVLPKGAIFVHDKEDQVHGSIADGCLTLCWTPDGRTYGWIDGEGLHLHPVFKRTDLLKLVKQGERTRLQKLADEMEEVLGKAKKELEKFGGK